MKCLILIASIFSLSRAANELVINAPDGSYEEIVIKNVNDEVYELIKDEELNLGKKNLLATLTVLEKTYTVSLQIKFTSNFVWHSIIQLTNNNVRENNPEFTVLEIIAVNPEFINIFPTVKSTVKDVSEYFATHIDQQLYDFVRFTEWTSIRISQVKNNGRYIFSVYVNGKQVDSVENISPQSFEHVKVFLGDSQKNNQPGFVKELRIQNGAEDQYIIRNVDTTLVKGKMIAEIPRLDKEHLISVDLYPTKFVDGYHNVIHFTIGSDYANYGDRVPSIYLNNDFLHIAVPINGNSNYYVNLQQLSLQTWTSIEISQNLKGSVYEYTMKVNGKILFSQTNNQAQSFEKVKVYASDPWYPAQEGYIRNLYVNGISNFADVS